MLSIDKEISEYSLAGAIDLPPCNRPMQNHLRQCFLDAQGTSMKDSKARERRAENARRYAKWAATSALNATGNRPI